MVRRIAGNGGFLNGAFLCRFVQANVANKKNPGRCQTSRANDGSPARGSGSQSKFGRVPDQIIVFGLLRAGLASPRPCREYRDPALFGISRCDSGVPPPRSRTNPQYNQTTLPETLATYQIGYEHIAELGGRRGKQLGLAPAVNAFWRNQSFHNYADYAMTGAFRVGLATITEFGHLRPTTIMCSEAVWWRCHRRIIADYLISAGDNVVHILGAG